MPTSPHEMVTIEPGEKPSRTLTWKPLTFISHIKCRTNDDRFSSSQWESFSYDLLATDLQNTWHILFLVFGNFCLSRVCTYWCLLHLSTFCQNHQSLFQEYLVYGSLAHCIVFILMMYPHVIHHPRPWIVFPQLSDRGLLRQLEIVILTLDLVGISWRITSHHFWSVRERPTHNPEFVD